MPFVSQRDQRSRDQQSIYQTEPAPARSSFGEVFSAAVGQVVDEEMSISGSFNREGWAKRKSQVEQLIDAGKLDKNKYMVRNRRGAKFDYDAAAKDFPEIASTETLQEERKLLLKMRREYAQDVIDRGSGTAQFLGAMSAYMLDPISIATLPISTAGVTARGLQGIGQTAIRAGAIEGIAEAGIQSFVYRNKQDIESPYDWKDALSSIATAATGAALLSGAGKGIADFLQGAKVKAQSLPASDDIEMATESIDRMLETLKDNPYKKEGMPTEELVNSEKRWLEELEIRRKQINESASKADDYIEPESKPMGRGEDGQRARKVLSEKGLLDEYDRDLLTFKQRQGTAGLYQIEQNFSGIKIKSKGADAEADKVWRQAVKRRKSLDVLEKCLRGSNITDCLKKAGKSINSEDANIIKAKLSELEAKGLGGERLSIAALDEAKLVLGKELKSISEKVKKAGGKVNTSNETKPIQVGEETASGDIQLVDASQRLRELDETIKGIDDVIRCSVGEAA